MLNQEELDKIVKDYVDKAEENGLKVGFLLKADGKLDNVSIKGATVDVSKFKYAYYPHLELNLIDDKSQPVANLCFSLEEHLGDAPLNFEKSKIYPKGTFFLISDLKKVVECFNIGGIDSKPYFDEKRELEEKLQYINNIIEKFELKED